MYNLARRGLSTIGASYLGRALQVVGATLVRGVLLGLQAVLEILILWLNQLCGEPAGAYLPFVILELTCASHSQTEPPLLQIANTDRIVVLAVALPDSPHHK